VSVVRVANLTVKLLLAEFFNLPRLADLDRLQKRELAIEEF